MLNIIKDMLPVRVSEEYIIDNITIDYKEDLFQIYSNDKIAKYVARKTHTSIKDTEEFMGLIRERMKDNTDLYLGIYTLCPKKLIGIIRFLEKEEPSILTIGYALSEEYWGKGIMPMSVNSLISLIKQEGKYSTLRATVREENINSQSCIEKLGFELSGKLKKTEIVNGKEIESERLLYFRKL